jgi:hypothetical protein
MTIATLCAAGLLLAWPTFLASDALAQQPTAEQSDQGRNGTAPSATQGAPGGSNGPDSARSEGTSSRLSGPSTPDHAWHGDDPLKSRKAP